MSTPEQRLQEMHIDSLLPSVPKPLAKYRTALLVGNTLYLAGHLPLLQDGKYITGKVGATLTAEEGKAAARQTALAMLSTIRETLGSLNRVQRLIKTLGLVNSTPEFTDHPKVINGFSELMAEVFGDERGVGVRSAFGASGLPAGAAVEVECVFQVEP